MLAQFVQDLVHLERREDRLDQHGGLDRAARDAELVLRHHEDVVPQPCLEVALHLRQVEVRTGAAREQFLRVVEEVEREVEDAAGHRLAVDPHVLLGQVPAARADHQHRGVIAHRIMLATRGIGVVEPSAPIVPQVHLPLDELIPGRRCRILEIGHEDLGAAVQRIDHHLRVGWPGNLNAAVEQVVAQMPARLREILILAYYQKCSYVEISEMLRIPLGTVKSRLHSAVRRFAKDWDICFPLRDAGLRRLALRDLG